MKENTFSLNGKCDYAPVIFKEPDFFRAIATAMYAKTALYIRNDITHKWELLYSPSAPECENQKSLGKYGILWGQLKNRYSYGLCRFDALYQKKDNYYLYGAGVIVLPERKVINRYGLYTDAPLPDCPLEKYDIFSVADYMEFERLIHEMPPFIPGEENEDDDVIVIEPGAKFKRAYPILPYSYWRIKQILNDRYNARLVCVRAYKEGRYPGYKQRYYIYDNSTNELLEKDVRLDTLRRRFAKADIPLKDSNINRNPKAEAFLNIIRQIIEQRKKENGKEGNC